MAGSVAVGGSQSLRGLLLAGNLRAVNRWRIAGLIIVTLLAAWLVLRSCLPEEPPPPPLSPSTREAFHAARPLRLTVVAAPDTTQDLSWLDLELRSLLSRGKMRVASVGSDTRDSAFTLRVTSQADRAVSLALIAPDGVIEKEERVETAGTQRLDIMGTIADRLPAFLNAAHASEQWRALIGTTDSSAYESFLNAASNVLGPNGTGFTHAPAAPRARNVEKLEALTRHQPKFARARAVLAAAYLNVGGQDVQSLTQLAESSAERALSLEPGSSEATAAQGLVHMRRNEWVAARDRFERALELDANSIVALEGLACLLVDTGKLGAARPYADRAVALQPANVGAQECRAYAGGPTTEPDTPSAARVEALRALIRNDAATARRLLQASLSERELAQWAEPLLQAAENRSKTPRALRAVTRAASESNIDAATEIFAGAALKESDFVLNRMSRLQRQREPVPLRLLWMKETPFLRKHARFHDIVDGAGLLPYWQEHGVPEICTSEPRVYGCKAGAARGASSSR
jgi:tetratricopeptide (TPR) repeat protein